MVMVYFDEDIANFYRSGRKMLPTYTDRRMEITVNETKEYTAEGAWAHTMPSAPQRFMNRLPPEFTDYRKVPELEKHEALHNVLGLAGYDEGFVTAFAMNPSSDIEFHNRAMLVRR